MMNALAPECAPCSNAQWAVHDVDVALCCGSDLLASMAMPGIWDQKVLFAFHSSFALLLSPLSSLLSPLSSRHSPLSSLLSSVSTPLTPPLRPFTVTRRTSQRVLRYSYPPPRQVCSSFTTDIPSSFSFLCSDVSRCVESDELLLKHRDKIVIASFDADVDIQPSALSSTMVRAIHPSSSCVLLAAAARCCF